MTNDPIVAALSRFSADLSPSSQAGADALRQPRAAIAAAAMTSQAGGFAAPAPARALALPPLDPATASLLGEVAEQAAAARPEPQFVARRLFSDHCRRSA